MKLSAYISHVYQSRQFLIC